MAREFPSPYRGLFLIQLMIMVIKLVGKLVSVPLSGIVSYTKSHRIFEDM